MKKKSLVFLLPVLVFIILVGFLAAGLRLDPREVPSPLIGKPTPDFSLPVLDVPASFSPAEYQGKVWLLNVWASWCSGCRSEHETLLRLSNTGQVDLIGMDYKDTDAAARQWLNRLGNPYKFVVTDANGKAGIDLGVYGVPETFIIDKKGIIRHKHIGPITDTALKDTILPLVKRLEKES
jgi:cytochrome c biogenesis protein CcmG/thiol:disulfide interchange protein DsbE